MTDRLTYDLQFYQLQAGRQLRSARAIVPIVYGLIRPSSVVDVGCGCGAWLATFREFGATRALGLDGDGVPPSLRMAPPACFRTVDLSGPVTLDEKFDLALCTEVAEHLPESRADGLVTWLTGLAPVVLFSAAVPLQGGTHHLNEQWPQYWAALFGRCGFTRLDVIRRHILNDERIPFWYRQNIFLYVRADRVHSYSGLAEAGNGADDLMIVHTAILREHLSLRGTLRRLPARVATAAVRKLSGKNGTVWP